jgi:signal peptidase II
VIRVASVAVSLLVLLADQLSKGWVADYFSGVPGQHQLTSFFNLVLTWNTGVSFGLLRSGSSLGVLLLSALVVAIVVALQVWMWRSESALVALGIGLICGGALGNLTDRLRWGAVRDFLDFHWSDIHFWAFNLADSAVFVGVLLLLTESLLARPKHNN